MKFRTNPEPTYITDGAVYHLRCTAATNPTWYLIYGALNHVRFRASHVPYVVHGAPRVIRTPDLRIRSPTLYPAELWAHCSIAYPLTPTLSHLGDCVVIIRTVSKEDGRDGRGCWAACREAACQRINETLLKVLERQPFTCEIHMLHPLEMTLLSTNID
jgi:hypothetical protein